MTENALHILVASRAYDHVVGGVERMSIALMNEMVSRGHRVTLLSWDGPGAIPFYPLDPRVEWRKIGGGDWRRVAGWRTRLRRARQVRAAVRAARPDVMIAFQSGMFIALRLFTLGQGVPVIAAERNAPQRFDYLKEGRRRALIFLLLRLARRVTIQSASYRAHYPAFLRRRLTVIPNPVETAAGAARPGVMADEMRLLCVGRLSRQKNQLVLLDAFARLAGDYPAWRLTLVGDGEGRALVEAAIDRLDLGQRAELIGAVGDVAPWYCRSQLFCLPSLWEGFPNALAEAMAHGLPAVAFRGCAGMAELIEDQRTGWLAPGNDDVGSLAATLRAAMEDAGSRAAFGAAAREAMRAYRPAEIFTRWEDLFRTTARPTSRR